MERRLLIPLISVIWIFGCSRSEPDTIVLSPSEVSLKKGDTHQIQVNSKSTLTYEIENDFHGKVTADGKVTAGYVGETTILVRNAEDSKPLKIIVEPRNKLYPDPVLEYGKSKNDIRAKYGTPADEVNAALAYNNYSANAPGILFLFDTSGRCSGITVLIKTSLVNQVAEFISERFVRISNTELYFADSFDPNKTKSIVILDVYNSLYYSVTYMNAADGKGAGRSTPIYNAFNPARIIGSSWLITW